MPEEEEMNIYINTHKYINMDNIYIYISGRNENLYINMGNMHIENAYKIHAYNTYIYAYNTYRQYIHTCIHTYRKYTHTSIAGLTIAGWVFINPTLRLAPSVALILQAVLWCILLAARPDYWVCIFLS